MSTTILPEPARSTFEASDRPFQLRTVVAGVEFTETSLHALEFTIALAQRFDATLHIAHVFGGEDEFLPAASALEYLAQREAKTRLKLEAKKRAHVDLDPALCHLRLGKPAAELCALACEVDADLVVVATEGRTGFERLTLGSTAQKVVRHAPCPVLVVPKRSRTLRVEQAQHFRLEKIVVPVDFSQCAEAGALYASHFASRLGANLLLVHVVNPVEYMTAEGAIYGMAWQGLVEQTRGAAEEHIETLANQLPLIGIEAETRVVVGDPHNVLEQVTREPSVDLVITSTHGRTGLAHVFLGSTAEYLVRVADCPVLVVPNHPR